MIWIVTFILVTQIFHSQYGYEEYSIPMQHTYTSRDRAVECVDSISRLNNTVNLIIDSCDICRDDCRLVKQNAIMAVWRNYD